MAVTSTLGNSVSESHSKIKSQVPSTIVAPDSDGLNNNSTRNSNVATKNIKTCRSNNSKNSSINECGDDIEGSLIEIEPLNDVMHYSPHSSQHTAYSNSNSNGNSTSQNSSIGESSLSSFLSILFEDDESNHRKICIVPDNPKPEQHIIRELHLSFLQSALENDKPKSRWDHITEDNRDNRRNKHSQHLMPSSNSLSRTRTTQKRSSSSQSLLNIRSSSFSGRISNAKRGLRTSNSFSLGQSSNSNSAASMFLRMPERKGSPTTGDHSPKKLSTLADRFVMMSDPGLVHLPMHLPLPSRNNSNRTRNRNNSKSSSGRVAQSQSRTNRFGDCEPSNNENGNASWSKEDVLERRKRNSNCFLDNLIELDGYEQLETLKISSSRSLSSCLEAVQEPSSPSKIDTTTTCSSKKNSHDGFCSSSPPKKPMRNTKSPRTPTRRMKSPLPNPHHILLNTIPHL